MANRMRRINPSLRISAALALMSVSVLMLADILGFIPDQSELLIKHRAEAIEEAGQSVQGLVLRGQTALINSYVRRIVRSNPEVEGLYIEDAKGQAVLELGQIDPVAAFADDGAEDHAVISINSQQGHWGDIAIAFKPVRISTFSGFLRHPLVRLALFLGLAGFLVYEVYLRRILRHLDPTSVMPERVRTIMDALAEGVVLIDDRGQIVMTNVAFAQTVNLDIREIPGRQLTTFAWGFPEGSDVVRLPWESAVESGVAQEGVLVMLTVPGRGHRYFSLNATPIMDDDGHVRGALTTFDDQTEIVQKNNELKKALDTLSAQQVEIEKQNEELRLLATRDPLTGCLNRRAFFDIFEKEFVAARKRFQMLACVMCDIDHFKSINDTFGHSVGDKVIQKMAECVRQAVRENDHVCRYGGEEFCVLLPGLDMEAAAVVAERVRVSIEAEAAQSLRLTGDRTITASFGVTDLNAGAGDLADLIDQADNALYRSKDNGRNQVTVFTRTVEGSATPEVRIAAGS